MKPIVYIASPYTKGDSAINTHFQMRIFDRMLRHGIVIPFAPLWSHFQHLSFPRPYEDWIECDNAYIRMCDACIRLDADVAWYHESESSGADREVDLFKTLDKPVFYSLMDLYEWVSQREGENAVSEEVKDRESNQAS